MATRRRNPQTIGKYSWLLHSGDAVEQGEAVGFDTASGDIRPMSSITTLIFMGWALEALTGDGTKKLSVELPEEVEAEWLANDSAPNDVDGTDRGAEVYFKDAKTVSTLSTSRSKAGRVLDYDADSNLVLVQGGTAVTGPTGTGGFSRSVATRAALTAIAAASRNDGDSVLVRSDNSLWRFNSAASFTSDENQQLGCTPDAGTGRWVRVDKTFVAKLRFTKDTADAAALLTVPTGFAIRLIGMPYWDVVTGFTGGTNSAIGISASAIATTKGDLLGGASGQLTAVLGTAGIKAGTIGPLIDTLAEIQAFFLKAADYLRADLIASQYAAGDGYACFPIAVEIVGAQT